MKRWQIIFGIGLILLGLFALIDVLTGINLWGLVFPLILIGIGILLILRPRMAGREVQVQMPFLGDLRKKGAWEVGNHEIWLLIGSIRLDFTDAVFLPGEPKIKLFGLVNDLKIILPEDVGLYLTSSAFVSEFKSPSDKEERILTPLAYETLNYTSTEKRVQVEVLGFVSEIQVKPPLM